MEISTVCTFDWGFFVYRIGITLSKWGDLHTSTLGTSPVGTIYKREWVGAPSPERVITIFLVGMWNKIFQIRVYQMDLTGRKSSNLIRDSVDTAKLAAMLGQWWATFLPLRAEKRVMIFVRGRTHYFSCIVVQYYIWHAFFTLKRKVDLFVCLLFFWLEENWVGFEPETLVGL